MNYCIFPVKHLQHLYKFNSTWIFFFFFAGGYVVVPEKLPNYVVPDLTNFKVQEFYNIGCLSG